ncbi:MAG: nucleotide sugar dehydrogenase [Thermoplasmata archaeon]
MSIAVVGLGYVGLPLACKFADNGEYVFGIDVNEEKVNTINKGILPFGEDEPGLIELFERVIKSGRLKATDDFSVCREVDAIFICTQTPIDEITKEPIYDALKNAVLNVGKNIKPGILVVVESTVAPYTMEKMVKPILEEASGLKVGKDLQLVHCPERIAPGVTLLHIETMHRVVGGNTKEGIERAIQYYRKIVKGDLDPTDWLTAEVVKTVENAERDLKIAFANEIAMACEAIGIDYSQVRKFVNKAPLRDLVFPGPGVGGHCIPKDPYLFIYALKGKFKPKLLLTARKVNEKMPEHVVELVKKALKKNKIQMKDAIVTILGYAYKENTDDTRNTPAEEVRKLLEKKVKEVRVHDPHVNTKFVEKDLIKCIQDADCLVLVTAHNEYKELSPEILTQHLRHKIIVDTRNFLPEMEGFTQICLGVGK